MNTLQMMRGAAAAEIYGGLEKYVEAMFHHMGRHRKKWTIRRYSAVR